MKTRNSEVLTDFIAYCLLHPDERFWQALRNWVGVKFIVFASRFDYDYCSFLGTRDTFYFEGKDK
jgi:hypothetical protein